MAGWKQTSQIAPKIGKQAPVILDISNLRVEWERKVVVSREEGSAERGRWGLRL
jgi:hypothetical protein